MARRFLTDVDLLSFSLLNARMHPVSADPSGLGTSDAGRVWFNSTTGKFMVWNGTAAIDFLARSNHTGTQTASTISDLAVTVQAYPLNAFAAAAGDVSLNGHKLASVADPTASGDAATKNYVDTQLSGLSSGQVLKGAVRVAATTNVSLSSPGTAIDGVTLAANDVVLLTGQTTASQNGPYVWTASGSALTRASNWDTAGEAVLGSYWIVREGSNADTFALLTNDTAITLDTTALAFVFRGTAGATYTAGNGLTLSGTDFNVGAGTGISVAADTVGVDTSVVARKITGTIPTATSGIFSVSGATVTINHALGNSAPQVVVRYGSGGTTPGQLVEVDDSASDTNNVVLTLPAAPSANQYVVSIVG